MGKRCNLVSNFIQIAKLVCKYVSNGSNSADKNANQGQIKLIAVNAKPSGYNKNPWRVPPLLESRQLLESPALLESTTTHGESSTLGEYPTLGEIGYFKRCDEH